MPDMRLTIAGRLYSVTCQPGEEQHLARLGAMLDAAARKAGATGGLTETRTLLFAGLLLADELAETQDRAAERSRPRPPRPSPPRRNRVTCWRTTTIPSWPRARSRSWQNGSRIWRRGLRTTRRVLDH